MTSKSTHTLLVLFEDEVRLAAKMLRAVIDLPGDATDADYTAAVNAAMDACIHALAGADDESAALLLGRKPIRAAASLSDQVGRTQ